MKMQIPDKSRLDLVKYSSCIEEVTEEDQQLLQTNINKLGL